MTVQPTEHMASVDYRFWENVDRSGQCWEWTARRNTQGYGQMRIGGKDKRAHRIAWELDNGPIPGGKQIDHICHNRGCVRPSHLRVVTNKQNGENRGGAQANSKSGIRGVVWNKNRNKWAVHVGHNRKLHFGGHFTDLASAEQAAIALRNQFYTHNDLDRAA